MLEDADPEGQRWETDPIQTPKAPFGEFGDSTIFEAAQNYIAWWVPNFAVDIEPRAEALLHNSDSMAINRDLETLRDVARCLRTWAACTRIDSGVAPSRRIIAPQIACIAPEEEESDCGVCQALG